MHKALTVTFATASCTLLLTSCAGRSGGDARPATLRAQRAAAAVAWPEQKVTAGLAKGRVLPVERYLETYPQLVTVQAAKNKAVKACMARFGQDFNPPQPGLNPPSGGYDAANMKRRYGLTDSAEAEKHGYAATTMPNGPVGTYDLDSPEANLAYDLEVPAGEKVPESLNGRKLPEKGCLGEADRAIGTFDDSLAEKINLDSFATFRNDPGVKDVTTDWSACLKKDGFAEPDPLTAINRSTAADRKQAAADIACKKSTDLVPVYFAAEVRIQNAAISRLKDELEAQKAKNSAVVAKAETYLD
ncbi:hypothetical protein [Streptomyces sp. NPDC005573]|uniref:hypothetical protein n=1 Tax=Streptomyces sp. NPDC005573 TaxID=3156890 RepID=UPI0033B1C622